MRAVHRHKPRRAHRRAARRCARVCRQLAPRGSRRDYHRPAFRDAQRSRRGQCNARGPRHSICRGRAAHSGRRTSVPARRSSQARDAQIALSHSGRAGRPLRALARRPWTDGQPRAQRKRGVLEPRLRHAAQSRRHGREQGRSGAAARRGAALYRPAYHGARQVPPWRAQPDHQSRQGPGQDQRSWQMMTSAIQPSSVPASDHIAPAPRVAVQAFCETVEIAGTVQAAGEDRRLAKAHVKVQMGGITAALEAYRSAPTPNVILIESESRGDDLLRGLDSLAEVCDSGTRVIVIGRHNDVVPYRELLRRGVSDYLILPAGALDVVRSICGLFSAPDAKPVGRVIAVLGAKGGVGASTVAHNIAWSIARDLQLDTVVGDLDLAFGNAGLDFNQAPPQGVADAVFSPERIDSAFIDRLLSKCTDHLSLLAAPATLDRLYDFAAEAFDPVYDALRASIPCTVLDVPHQWTGWTRRSVVAADDILIVAGPDLANLRNTKNLLDLLRAARPHDHPPSYCLNQVGVPKRPEIKAADFAKALDAEPVVTIPFEPHMFGTAANNGQMIAELSSSQRLAESFRQLAQLLTGRAQAKKASSGLLSPLLGQLMKRSA